MIVYGGSRSYGLSVMGMLLLAGAVGVVLVILLLFRKSRPAAVEAPPPPAVPARLSLLSVFSLLSALLALLTGLTGFILADVARFSDIAGLDRSDRGDFLLFAEIFRYAALLPALSALAFSLAGGGAIRESRGALRGRALSRMAMILALAVGVATLSVTPGGSGTVARHIRMR